MSEVKLNLTDAQRTLNGTIHHSIIDACVAALSAEPETIPELEAALERFINPVGESSPFASFRTAADIDTEPWDAGIAIIDLAARLIASNSASRPRPKGEVHYHDDASATNIPVLYRLPDDWLFLNSIEEYQCLRKQRRQERAATPPLYAREVLYGRPLLEWVVSAIYSSEAVALCIGLPHHASRPDFLTEDHAYQAFGPVKLQPHSNAGVSSTRDSYQACDSGSPPVRDCPCDALVIEISALHALWLMTPRDDLQGKSPREVLLAKQAFIDFDLHTRSLQWSLQGEGPPCLATDSFAYRFGGFGTHEWVVYYDLVRHLLWSALPSHTTQQGCSAGNPDVRLFGPSELTPQTEYVRQVTRLEELKTNWLDHSQEDYGGRMPALIIENERIRLPIAMRAHDMVIDDDCPVCRMMGDDTGLGMEIGFWHLDGSHMDDDFAFSSFHTREEWEADRRRWQEFKEEFNREWEEREQRIARGQPNDSEADLIVDDLFVSDLIDWDSSGTEDKPTDLL